ncbi:MAG: transcriptional regulator, partial [Brevundimonas sp.]
MIDNRYLLGLYSGTSTSTGSSTTLASLTAASRKKQPTAPWSTSSKSMPEASELVRAALGGRKIISESDQTIDVSGASADYKKLFALYQGLETLTQLANRASVKGVSASETALLAKRFTAGLAEVGDYMASTTLDGVRLVQGISSSVSKSTSGVKRDQPNYVTGPIHEGALTSEVAAFQGSVAFSISAKRSNGETLSVDVDLSAMGGAPRTLDNVIKHVNTQLEAAGIETRFGREQVPAEEKTLTVNGKTVTLPAGADHWALVVKGTSTEAITFSA